MRGCVRAGRAWAFSLWFWSLSFLWYSFFQKKEIIPHTDKKENKIFLIYMKFRRDRVQTMRKGFLIYEEMCKFFSIYEEAVSHIWLCTRSLLISLYMKKLLFDFLSVQRVLNDFRIPSFLAVCDLATTWIMLLSVSMFLFQLQKIYNRLFFVWKTRTEHNFLTF